MLLCYGEYSIHGLFCCGNVEFLPSCDSLVSLSAFQIG